MPPDEPTMPDDDPTVPDGGPDTPRVCRVSEHDIGMPTYSRSHEKHGLMDRIAGTQTGNAHETIETKITEAKRIREQLIQAIAVSHTTVFAVDRNRKLTMLAGALVKDSRQAQPNWHIGKDVYDVFNRLDSGLADGQMPPFLAPLEPVLAGEAVEDAQKHEISRRSNKPNPG